MLRPTFLSFETAKRALSASQRGLDTVGHNISNVNTIGYTRQRVDQVSISSSGYKTKFQEYGSQFSGQGAKAIGISQIRDPFLDNRYRTEATNAGEFTAKSNALADINAIFDEIMVDGSHAKLEEFLAALDKLSVQAFSKENATVLRTQAEEIAKLLGRNMADLQYVKTTQQEELGFAIDDVNTMLQQIAHLNTKIEEDNFYGNPANELNDERNLLIDQLSEMVDIRVSRTPVTLDGGITIEKLSIEIKNSAYTDSTGKKIGAVVLVNSGDYNNLALAKKTDGSVSVPAKITLVDGHSGFPIYDNPSDKTSDDLTGKLFAGGLKGSLDVLNGDGSNPNPPYVNKYRGIPYYEDLLNEYATTLADKMNSANALKVMADATTTPPTYVTIERPLFQYDSSNPAATLAISKEWDDNPQYITNIQRNQAFYTDSAGNLCFSDSSGTPVDTGIHYTALAGSRVDKDGYLLDAGGNQILSTSGDALNIADLQRCFTVDDVSHSVGQPLPNDYVPGSEANDGLIDMKLALTDTTIQWGSGFTGNLQEYLTRMQSTLGQDSKFTDSLLDASIKVLTGLADSRDSVSAVSIDEEGISMMTYQNYYNAAARYMTVLDEALGTIIQSMGVVGR